MSHEHEQWKTSTSSRVIVGVHLAHYTLMHSPPKLNSRMDRVMKWCSSMHHKLAHTSGPTHTYTDDMNEK